MALPFSFQFPPSVTNLVVQQPNHLKASDDTLLAYYDFVSKNPEAIMIFYHGGGAWSNQLYQYMAQQLQEIHDIGVYLVDIRGHGNSQGNRGDAPSTDQVYRDISAVIDLVQQKYQGTPVFLGGHSSGAGLVLNYSGWKFASLRSIKGYVFLAPFLGSKSGTAYEHDDVTKRFIKNVRLFPLIINAITGGFFFAHTPVIFFNYPEEQKRKDAFLLEYYTCAMSQATTPYDAKNLFEKLDKPYVLLVAEGDEQFIPEKILAYHEHAKQVKEISVVRMIKRSTHLSIVHDAPSFIAVGIQKIILM